MRRASDGSLTLACKHPVNSPTWHWAIVLTRKHHVTWGYRIWLRAAHRAGQWHDYYRLPFGWSIIVSRQDYHKRSAA